MKCESCNKSFKRIDLISTEVGLVCQKCMDKSLEINRCPVCGREFSKWRFCLECGHINHRYTNKNYIGEGE